MANTFLIIVLQSSIIFTYIIYQKDIGNIL